LLLQNPENNVKHKRFVQTETLLCYRSLKSSPIDIDTALKKKKPQGCARERA